MTATAQGSSAVDFAFVAKALQVDPRFLDAHVVGAVEAGHVRNYLIACLHGDTPEWPLGSRDWVEYVKSNPRIDQSLAESVVKPSRRDDWFDLYTEVHADVFYVAKGTERRTLAPEWALRTVLLRRRIGRTHDVYMPVSEIAEYLNVDVKTLESWARDKDCPLWSQFPERQVKYRPDPDTGRLVTYWSLTPRSINKNSDGTLVDPKVDRYVKIPHWWLFENPSNHDGNEWVRRPTAPSAPQVDYNGDQIEDARVIVDAKALYVAAVLGIRAGTNSGIQKSVFLLAQDAGISLSTWKRGARSAEAAGLYIHVGSRSGRRAAYRSAQLTPPSRTTFETRRPSQRIEGTEAYSPPSFVGLSADDCPF